MGKIRIKTLGSEELEEKEGNKKKTRKEQKRAAEETAHQQVETEAEKLATGAADNKQKKKQDRKTPGLKPKHTRSKKYTALAKLVDKTKTYSLSEALKLLEKIKLSRMDETVELHINTTEAGILGTVTFPHGSGKMTRVKIADPAKDKKGFDELIKNLEKGIFDFDVLVATPDAMTHLAKFARFLGPRGLMPNPKNGTVTNDPQTVVKGYEKGKMRFKTESKFPTIHLRVGKISFGEKKLSENIKEIGEILTSGKIKKAVLKSTMSPGIKVDLFS